MIPRHCRILLIRATNGIKERFIADMAHGHLRVQCRNIVGSDSRASVGIPSLLIGVCLVGLIITMWSSQQFRFAGPDSNTAAILAVSLASIGLDARAKGVPNWP